MSYKLFIQNYPIPFILVNKNMLRITEARNWNLLKNIEAHPNFKHSYKKKSVKYNKMFICPVKKNMYNKNNLNIKRKIGRRLSSSIS